MDKNYSFQQFTEAVAEKIREYLPESFADAIVELSTITKNNDMRLTGLTIRSLDKNISPTIYLEQFYERYQDGEDMTEVLERIAELRIRSEVNDKFDTSNITDFNKIKDRIVPKIINRDWNKELLKDRVHTFIADLAVVYQISINSGFGGNASVAVTNQLAKQWDVDADTLHELAVKNMHNLFPSTFEPMSKVLATMMGEGAAEMFTGGCPEDEMMWVLSNTERINGGSAVLDENMMKKIVEKFGENGFYLICSSIHEWLIVRKSEGMKATEIELMIKSVNEQVAQDERLGDHPYRYSIEEGLLPV